jgi:hypothetical protein
MLVPVELHDGHDNVDRCPADDVLPGTALYVALWVGRKDQPLIHLDALALCSALLIKKIMTNSTSKMLDFSQGYEGHTALSRPGLGTQVRPPSTACLPACRRNKQGEASKSAPAKCRICRKDTSAIRHRAARGWAPGIVHPVLNATLRASLQTFLMPGFAAHRFVCRASSRSATSAVLGPAPRIAT